MSKFKVNGVEITVLNRESEDFMCLTDMVKHRRGDSRAADIIKNWIRTRGTIEFLGTWERLYNPNFKVVEFDHFKKESGLPTFTMSVSNWVDKTNAIGVFSKSGKYGGTYAHKDIALEFCTAISPEFKLLVLKEFQRLKDEERRRVESGWDYRRFLSKTNYAIHTDAIKHHIIPELTEEQAKYAYANEGDLLNVAMFGMTAKQWQQKFPQYHNEGRNMRDLADVHQLIVLTNLESSNAYLITKKMPQRDRLLELRKMAVTQLASLRNSNYTIEKIKSPFGINSSGDKLFDNTIDKLLGVKNDKK